MLLVFVQEPKKKKCPSEHQFPLLRRVNGSPKLVFNRHGFLSLYRTGTYIVVIF